MPFLRHLRSTLCFATSTISMKTGQVGGTHLSLISEVFLAVRNDVINAYVNGGSIGRIRWDGSHQFCKFVNHAYLVLPARIAILATTTSSLR